MELPIDPRRAERPEPQWVAGAPLRRACTVLIVDDEPDVAEMLVDLLGLDDHRVDVASDGRAALEKLRAQTYDLILSDLRMPGLDGPELYEAIKRDHSHLLGRVIFLTGDELSPDITAFLEGARVPYLNKPFTLKEIRRVLQQVLR
jgi:CheY-like chemotaxis protein